MFSSFEKKQSLTQKKDAPSTSSIFDSSSQSESLQRKAELANGAVQREEPPRPNNTGMPDNLKTGIESLSGFSMDDVRVHYNSSKPATVQALAYTQGTDIHVAPGQEKHLPHEAWHVAQQMAGRVFPTTNINGMPVNDNAALEHEADVMGEKAVQCRLIDCGNFVAQNKFNNLIQCISIASKKNASVEQLYDNVNAFLDAIRHMAIFFVGGKRVNAQDVCKKLEKCLKDIPKTQWEFINISECTTIEGIAEAIDTYAEGVRFAETRNVEKITFDSCKKKEGIIPPLGSLGIVTLKDLIVYGYTHDSMILNDICFGEFIEHIQSKIIEKGYTFDTLGEKKVFDCRTMQDVLKRLDFTLEKNNLDYWKFRTFGDLIAFNFAHPHSEIYGVDLNSFILETQNYVNQRTDCLNWVLDLDISECKNLIDVARAVEKTTARQKSDSAPVVIEKGKKNFEKKGPSRMHNTQKLASAPVVVKEGEKPFETLKIQTFSDLIAFSFIHPHSEIFGMDVASFILQTQKYVFDHECRLDCVLNLNISGCKNLNNVADNVVGLVQKKLLLTQEEMMMGPEVRCGIFENLGDLFAYSFVNPHATIRGRRLYDFIREMKAYVLCEINSLIGVDEISIKGCSDLSDVEDRIEGFVEKKQHFEIKTEGFVEQLLERSAANKPIWCSKCVAYIENHKLNSGGGTNFLYGGKTVFHISHGGLTKSGKEGDSCHVLFVHKEDSSFLIIGVGYHTGPTSYHLNWKADDIDEKYVNYDLDGVKVDTEMKKNEKKTEKKE